VGLARVYLDQGHPTAAEPLLRHALGVQQSRPATEGWRLQETQSLLEEASKRTRGVGVEIP
jgi:hypothetical protein